MIYIKNYMYPVKFHNKENAKLVHYLVEIVMSRQAKRNGILLTPGFWNDPVWKKEYHSQMIAANAIVKTFKDEEIIISGINELYWVYSLRNKQLSESIYTKIAMKQKKQEIAAIKIEEVILDEVAAPERRKEHYRKGVDL